MDTSLKYPFRSPSESSPRVSILVLMDTSLKSPRKDRAPPERPVSILVLMDTSLKLLPFLLFLLPHESFQSLFLWILPLNPPYGSFPGYGRLVSILVLMDTSLKYCQCSRRRNPWLRVSILVLMDTSLKSLAAATGPPQ